MYNPQLETFIRVADAGSFNKAAEESFITPTAVIKQINLLEDSLGVKLFDRTHRGLHLTKAGHSLYQDSKYIIQYCRDPLQEPKMQCRKIAILFVSVHRLSLLHSFLWNFGREFKPCTQISNFKLYPLRTPPKMHGRF